MTDWQQAFSLEKGKEKVAVAVIKQSVSHCQLTATATATATVFATFARMSLLSELDKDDYYFSPEGYVVFTAKYLLKRGYCCQNGCKHCPYGYNKKTGRFDNTKKNTDQE